MLLLAVLCAAVGARAAFAPLVTEPAAPVRVAHYAQGTTNATLYALAAKGYTDPIYVLDLYAASHYDAGYAYASLLVHQATRSRKIKRRKKKNFKKNGSGAETTKAGTARQLYGHTLLR